MARDISLTRLVSLRWIEKLWLCVDFGQLYALLWVAAQPWPWPYLWIDWTAWTVWANLDYFSTTKDGALYGQTGNVGISQWGQMDDYLYYALAFSALPLLLSSPLLLWRVLTPRQRSLVTMAVLLLWQLLYLPCGLAVFRLYHCEDNNTLSADPTVSCTASKYFLYTAISTVLVTPLIVGLPLYMLRLTYDLAVYNFRHDHEKRLQAWEITYGLSLDDFWLDSQAWVMSSFKRNSSYFRTCMILLKFCLLLVFIFVRRNLWAQAGLYLMVTAVFSLPALRYRPFRLLSSNFIMIVLIFTLLCATTSAMMNAAGVQNAAMVASRQSIFLWALFSFALFLIVAIGAWSYFILGDDWPSALTIHRVNHSNMRPLVTKWIHAMAEANFIISDCLHSAAEIRDLTEFNRIVGLIRSCWLTARSNGSLFEVMLGEALDKLLIFHKAFFVPNNIRRTRDYLHSALLEAGDSLVRREKNTILMSRRKRGILTKMTALRAFLGGRILDDSFNQQHNTGMSYSGSLPHIESIGRLHIYEPEQPPPSNDWGVERDRTKDMLEKLDDTVKLTESVLQSEDPTERFRELVSIRDIWTEIVTLLDSGHVVENDLPDRLKTEDCYTYRRLIEDCLSQFEIPDEESSDANMWNQDNLAGLVGAQGYEGECQAKEGSVYGSIIEEDISHELLPGQDDGYEHDKSVDIVVEPAVIETPEKIFEKNSISPLAYNLDDHETVRNAERQYSEDDDHSLALSIETGYRGSQAALNLDNSGDDDHILLVSNTNSANNIFPPPDHQALDPNGSDGEGDEDSVEISIHSE